MKLNIIINVVNPMRIDERTSSNDSMNFFLKQFYKIQSILSVIKELSFTYKTINFQQSKNLIQYSLKHKMHLLLLSRLVFL